MDALVDRDAVEFEGEENVGAGHSRVERLLSDLENVVEKSGLEGENLGLVRIFQLRIGTVLKEAKETNRTNERTEDTLAWLEKLLREREHYFLRAFVNELSLIKERVSESEGLTRRRVWQDIYYCVQELEFHIPDYEGVNGMFNRMWLPEEVPSPETGISEISLRDLDQIPSKERAKLKDVFGESEKLRELLTDLGVHAIKDKQTGEMLFSCSDQ